MAKKLLYSILIFWLPACVDRPSFKESEIFALQDSTVAGMAKKSFVSSQAFHNATQEFGTYESLQHFILAEENISEFRIELLNIYEEQDFLKSINMIEVTWSHGFFKNRTVWFQQDSVDWKRLDEAVWNKGAEF